MESEVTDEYKNVNYPLCPKDFLDKCEWEGGNLYEGFEYGLTPQDLDDSNEDFKKIISEAYDLFRIFHLRFEELNRKAESLINWGDDGD